MVIGPRIEDKLSGDVYSMKRSVAHPRLRVLLFLFHASLYFSSLF